MRYIFFSFYIFCEQTQTLYGDGFGNCEWDSRLWAFRTVKLLTTNILSNHLNFCYTLGTYTVSHEEKGLGGKAWIPFFPVKVPIKMELKQTKNGLPILTRYHTTWGINWLPELTNSCKLLHTRRKSWLSYENSLVYRNGLLEYGGHDACCCVVRAGLR